jgi:DNA-binding transcriptional LysR family regulator
MVFWDLASVSLMAKMNLKQLEAVCCVARLGSFTAAATRLNTTQPAISGRIREIEQSLGVRIFERSGRRIFLTAKGREMLDYAERIVTLTSELRSRIGDPTVLRGFVRLGAVDTIALTWLPSLMVRLGSGFPAIVVELCIDHSISLRAKLLAREIDIALIAGHEHDPALISCELGRVENLLMGSPALRLDPPRLTPEILKGVPIICHARGTQLHSMMRQWFLDGGVEPPPFHGCSNVAAMIKLAVEGVGVGVFSPAVAEFELREGRLLILPSDPAIGSSSFNLVRHRTDLQATTAVVASLAIEVARRDRRFNS